MAPVARSVQPIERLSDRRPRDGHTLAASAAHTLQMKAGTGASAGARAPERGPHSPPCHRSYTKARQLPRRSSRGVASCSRACIRVCERPGAASDPRRVEAIRRNALRELDEAGTKAGNRRPRVITKRSAALSSRARIASLAGRSRPSLRQALRGECCAEHTRMKRSASTTPAAIRGAMRAYWFGPAEFLGHGDRLNSEGAYTPMLKTKNTDANTVRPAPVTRKEQSVVRQAPGWLGRRLRATRRGALPLLVLHRSLEPAPTLRTKAGHHPR
jgi:hypothetical protein